MNATPQPSLHGLIAEFASAADLCHAAEKVRDKGFRRWDVHTPYPIHGMDQCMGLPDSKVSLFSLLGAAAGLTTAFLMICLTTDSRPIVSAIMGNFNYPIIVSGKTPFDLEPSVPIFFELSILLTAFGTILGLLVMGRIPQLYHALFNWEPFAKVTDDGFFVVIQAADALFDETETTRFLESIGGTRVSRIED
jgi:hypothetical protein